MIYFLNFEGKKLKSMSEFQTILLTVAVIAAITLIAYMYSKKRMKNAWKGTVVKVKKKTKHLNRYSGDIVDTETYIYIYCRTDKGHIQQFRIEERACINRFGRLPVEGDKMEKKQNEWLPVFQVL
jgi:hypothetical protein